MNAKQEVFCRAYIIDFNGANAARRAGYSAKTAGQIAHSLLKKVEIRQQIKELDEARNRRLDLEADRVLRELCSIAFGNVGDFMLVCDDGRLDLTVLGASPEQLAAIASFQQSKHQTRQGARSLVKIRMHSKIKALTKLGEHLGLF